MKATSTRRARLATSTALATALVAVLTGSPAAFGSLIQSHSAAASASGPAQESPPAVASNNEPGTRVAFQFDDHAAIAIYCDDLGQSVPPPGLIRLGRIDAGLGEIADAGRRITVRIVRIDVTGS